MSRITSFLPKSRGRVPALFILALLLSLAAMTLAGAQVAHEDPRMALPTTSTASSDQISALLSHSLTYFDNISYSVKTFDFTQAGHSYYKFNQSCVELETMIWQLNNSNRDYDAIGDSLNSTNTGLSGLIDNANNYDHSRQLYNESVASDDIANISVYKVLVSDRYFRIINSYNDISSNISALSTQLQGKNVDTRPIQDSMYNFNSYIDWLNEDYGSLGIGANGSVLYCGANQSVATIGSDVRLSAYLVDSQGQPMKNSGVSFYVDNRLLGSNTTNDKGRSYIDYIVPATVERDLQHMQAEYVPEASAPGIYSNPVLLHVTDLYTTISMHLDKEEASYGDMVIISGRLSPLYGVYSGGRSINILYGDLPAGTAITDDNGSYEYDLSITPETLAGTFMLNGVYQQNPGDILLGTVSDETSLHVTAQNTSMALSCPAFANLGDMAAFNGTLLSASGKPVSGANVYLYIDDQESGNGTTDDNGAYMISAAIPDDATAGTHEVYTTFNPGIGVSLAGAASSLAEIRFNDTGKKIDAQGVPLVLFADDRPNLTGTLSTGAGALIPNRSLSIKVAGLSAITSVTDGAGNFNASYTGTGDGLPSLSTVTISDTATSFVLYDRPVLLIPFDKWKVLGFLVILAALISGAFVVVRRPGDRGPLQPRAKSFEAPARRSKPDFDIQGEISLVKASMEKHDARTALILIYAAARKAIALSGVEVTDAMTEDSFYDKAAAAFPRVAPPLRYIVISYQSAVDTHSTFSATELEMALKCLVYIDRELTASRGA